MRLLRLPVMAEFISSSVGGSTSSAVFSSADKSGSVPCFVTHGCSCSYRQRYDEVGIILH